MRWVVVVRQYYEYYLSVLSRSVIATVVRSGVEFGEVDGGGGSRSER
jgi:hypothetical protein